jgi:cell division protein FtsN
MGQEGLEPSKGVRRGTMAVVRGLAVIGMALAVLFLHPSCTKREVAGTREVPVRKTATSSPARTRQAGGDTTGEAGTRYSVEDEVPGKTLTKPVELHEKVVTMRPDTFAVQERAVEESGKARFSIVYRVQVFASSDRGTAEKVRQQVQTRTGLRAYLEYEDGLYKVRAGDFPERKAAAQARSKLVADYPGSWIVMTTVRK